MSEGEVDKYGLTAEEQQKVTDERKQKEQEEAQKRETMRQKLFEESFALNKK